MSGETGWNGMEQDGTRRNRTETGGSPGKPQSEGQQDWEKETWTGGAKYEIQAQHLLSDIPALGNLTRWTLTSCQTPSIVRSEAPTRWPAQQ